MMNELSGFLGDTKFFKNTFYLQNNFSIPYFDKCVFSTPDLANTFRLQTFINSGILTSPNKSLLDQVKSFTQQAPNISLGLGLIANIGNAIRFEINFCHPLKSQSGGIL
ncbi:hypothetical protein HZS_7855 [Henneguya salminicola]|nr:hypothetical protein HZS_7855 [Henneguya salminicola]